MPSLPTAWRALTEMKKSVLKKAREHCAQENKAIKLVSREGQGGSYSAGGGLLLGGLGDALGAGLTGAQVSSSGKGSEFDIVFKCRERTKATTKDAP